jgi:hypothetical protein
LERARSVGEPAGDSGEKMSADGRAWWLGLGEAGVEGGVVGDALADEIGLEPCILAGLAPHFNYGLLWSK